MLLTLSPADADGHGSLLKQACDWRRWLPRLVFFSCVSKEQKSHFYKGSREQFWHHDPIGQASLLTLPIPDKYLHHIPQGISCMNLQLLRLPQAR